MENKRAQKLLDTMVQQIFGIKNPLSLNQFMAKFAFDVRLPQQVIDSIDNRPTWAQSTNPTKYVRLDNAKICSVGGASPDTDFLRPKKPLTSFGDILSAWNEINFTTTERLLDCVDVIESDSIYRSNNVYRSQDIRDSKNILFCDGLGNCEFVAASQRSGDSTFCIRLEDSGECTNSFSASWCGKISNCLFMLSSSDTQDCMFCANLTGKRYCIANMQYSREEYEAVRKQVVQWIFSS